MIVDLGRGPWTLLKTIGIFHFITHHKHWKVLVWNMFLVVSTSLIFFYSQQKIGNDHWQCNDWLILLIVATHQSIFRSAPTSEIIQLRSFSMFDIKICCDLKQLFLAPFSDVGQQDTHKIQHNNNLTHTTSTSSQYNTMGTSPNHNRYVVYVWWI